MGQAKVLQAKYKNKRSWVIGLADPEGNILKALKSLDPISLKVEWSDRSEKAWNSYDKSEVEKVLSHLLEYKILK